MTTLCTRKPTVDFAFYQDALPQVQTPAYNAPSRHCLCLHTGGGDRVLAQQGETQPETFTHRRGSPY